VIFDFDGTIIDSMGSIYRILKELTRKHNLIEIEAPLLGELSGKPLREILMSRNPKIDPSLSRKMEKELFERYIKVCTDKCPPFPKVKETLETLRSRGIRLGVVTSTPREPLHSSLDSSGLKDSFDVILAREDVEQPKPAPEGILKALELLHAKADETLYVGDSPVDIAAGKAAGVRTVAVLTGLCPRACLEAERPDAVLRDLSYLPDYIEKSERQLG